MKIKDGIKLYNFAKTIIPGGTTLFSKRSELHLPNKWPAYFTKAKQTYLWDLASFGSLSTIFIKNDAIYSPALILAIDPTAYYQWLAAIAQASLQNPAYNMGLVCQAACELKYKSPSRVTAQYQFLVTGSASHPYCADP